MIELFGFSVALDLELALMWAIVFLAGIIRGFLGFGSALLVVPALSVLYGPTLAVVVGVLIEIPTTLGLLPVAVRQVERRTVTKMLLTFLVCVPLGTLLLKSVNPELMKAVISLVVLMMVAILAQQERMAVLLSQAGTLFAGAMSGLAQGMTGMGGPLFVTALLARGESAIQTRGNIVALAGGLIAISATSFILAGLVTRQAVIYTVLGTPAILLGVWAGSTLFRHLSRWNLRGIVLAFLALVALVSLAQTLT